MVSQLGRPPRQPHVAPEPEPVANGVDEELGAVGESMPSVTPKPIPVV